jgi:quercetin dioxygenase-like cupin family protein
MSVKNIFQTSGELRENIRGGIGSARWVEVLSPGELAGVKAMAVLTLDPGATIGEHTHTDTGELYLVLDGHGTGMLDGDRFPVGPGDAWICPPGHSHGLEVAPSARARLLALLT